MSKKKYVIESAFENVSVQKIMQLGLDANGRIINWTDLIEDVEELNSDYINEHYGELQDEAYRKGFDDGKASIENGCKGCKYEDQHGYDEPCNKCLYAHVSHYTSLPKEDDRIEVGDEVNWDGDKYVVTYLNYDIETSEITDYDLLAYDGSVVGHVKKCTFTKTGKHYDIQSILEAMRE